MFRHNFRKVLPLLQTVIAIAFGGWGLWLRDAIKASNEIMSRVVWPRYPTSQPSGSWVRNPKI